MSGALNRLCLVKSQILPIHVHEENMNVMPKHQNICITQKVRLVIQKHEHKKGNSDYRPKLVDLHRNRKTCSPIEERAKN